MSKNLLPMTQMENMVMARTNCERMVANLVVNDILNLNDKLEFEAQEREKTQLNDKEMNSKARIIIEVERGLVSAVYSDVECLVDILDRDDFVNEEEVEELEGIKELEDEIKQLKSVY